MLEDGLILDYSYFQIAPDQFLISVDYNVEGNNADKYEIKDRYRLKIYDVTFEDEGAYECSLGPNDYVGYLTVVGMCNQKRLFTCTFDVVHFNHVL